MNKIQYISLTHNSKDMAKHHKQMCNTLHNVYLKEMDFDEVADLLDNGQTWGRVGNKTDFVAIDIDETTVNIEQVFNKFRDNNNYRISYSSSNNPLKYHILVKLDKTIDEKEYKAEVEKQFNIIKDKVCGRCDFMFLDKNADKFYQCFYGQSVDSETEIILDNSTRLFKWCKKDDIEPMVYNEKKVVKNHPTLNSAEYCKKNGLLTIKEEKRFDVILPNMTNGKLKLIAEGHRYNWCKMIGTKILMRVLYLNNKFNEEWTKWDFLDTAEWVFRTNIVRVDTFEQDMKTLLLWLDNKWDILVTKSYDEQVAILEPYFDCSKKQYKSRKYNATMMTNIVLEHKFDDNTVVFTDKDELMNICRENLLDYYKFIKYVKSIHFNIEFEVIKLNKHEEYLNSCENFYDENGNIVYLVDREHKNNNTFRVYCSRNKINTKLK